MNAKLEMEVLEVAEITVETTEEQVAELSLAEMDMIGGGSVIAIYE